MFVFMTGNFNASFIYSQTSMYFFKMKYTCRNISSSPRTAERYGVQTHYYRLPYVTSDVSDQKCDSPTNAWVVRCLSWKTISVPWFGSDYWHSGRADNSNKTANNAKYSIARGWVTRFMTSAYKICDRGHFEFCLHFEFYFYPFSVYLQAKHDSFCA